MRDFPDFSIRLFAVILIIVKELSVRTALFMNVLAIASNEARAHLVLIRQNQLCLQARDLCKGIVRVYG